MGFQILRVTKVKTAGGMKALLDHAHRERDTPNADASKTPSNELLVDIGSTGEAIDRFNALMPAKHRKDAVLGLEYLVTATPASLNDLGEAKTAQYFQDAMKWLKERHGAQNIITAVVHKDESNPHLSVFVVPIVDGKLNAKAFTGGKKALVGMQDEFQEKVAKGYGLERGVPDTHIHHIPQAKLYARLSSESPAPQKSLLQKNKEVGIRDAVSKNSVREPDFLERLTPHAYAKEVGLELRDGAVRLMQTEIDAKQAQIDQLMPKAQAFDLVKLDQIRLKKREKDLKTKELVIELAEKPLHKIEAEKLEARNQGVEDGYQKGFKAGSARAQAELEIAHGDIRTLSTYRNELVAERDALHEEKQVLAQSLEQEKEAHQETRKTLSTLLRDIANAMPQRFLDLQKAVRERIGWKPAPPKRDMGIGR